MPRPSTDHATRFPVHTLLRRCSGTPTLWISWCRADGTTAHVPVATTTVRQRLGVRLHALCPGCGARRAVLHVHEDALGCRACLGLAYPSTRERPARRALRRSLKIRARLGTTLDPAAPLTRPAGMRHRTFAKLVAREKGAWSAVGAAIDRFARRMRRRARAR